MSAKQIIFIAVVLVFITIFLSIYFSIPSRQKIVYGVTFSQKFAEEVILDINNGTNWEYAYIDILDDLKVRDLRLIAYWDKIEPEDEKFDFKDLDWQVAEAEKRGARIIMAIGKKTPRWPECHIPSFAREFPTRLPDVQVANSQFSNALLNYIKITIEHYKNNASIIAWQIENEPLFPFGECETVGIGLLNKEISLVKSLDNRPIMLTDSGEMGFMWPYLAAKSDIFGTTLYRYVHNRILGDIRYSLIPPSYFRLKAWWANKMLGKNIAISELQAEPWSQISIFDTSLENQTKSMSPIKLIEIADYAEHSGFPKAYLWGVEWWYWMKEKNNKPEMWEIAKKLINNN